MQTGALLLSEVPPLQGSARKTGRSAIPTSVSWSRRVSLLVDHPGIENSAVIPGEPVQTLTSISLPSRAVCTL